MEEGEKKGFGRASLRNKREEDTAVFHPDPCSSLLPEDTERLHCSAPLTPKCSHMERTRMPCGLGFHGPCLHVHLCFRKLQHQGFAPATPFWFSSLDNGCLLSQRSQTRIGVHKPLGSPQPAFEGLGPLAEVGPTLRCNSRSRAPHRVMPTSGALSRMASMLAFFPFPASPAGSTS